MPSYVPIITIRGTSTVIDDTPVHDGQILFDESRKCLFMDNGNTRNKYSGLGADSNVATVEDTTTSTHAYAKGDYVVVEGQLYEVTAAIAVGDTFSVGTNVSVTTVGDELVQIKSDLSNIQTDLTEFNLPNISDFTHLTYGGQLNTGSTYVNTDIFNVPSTAKEIYVAFTVAGSVGGIQKFVKGTNVMCFDYQLDRCIFTWNPTTSKIKCSYAYMTAGGTVTWYCYYR